MAARRYAYGEDHELLGYVFLTSGAITTTQPNLYPARRDQIDNLRFAFDAAGDNQVQCFVEKAHRIKTLKSLPQLSKLLVHALAKNDRVLIDHFGRLFLACPASERGNFLKQLLLFRHIFYELQNDGRALATYTKDDLKSLLDVRSRINFRLNARPPSPRSPKELDRQTRNARLVSQAARKRNSDAKARSIQDLAAKMKATSGKLTLQCIVDEAARLGMTTTRGNPWSSSSVHRALRRVIEAQDTPKATAL